MSPAGNERIPGRLGGSASFICPMVMLNAKISKEFRNGCTDAIGWSASLRQIGGVDSDIFLASLRYLSENSASEGKSGPQSIAGVNNIASGTNLEHLSHTAAW